MLLLDEFQEVFRDDNKRLLSFGRGLVRKILNLRTLNVICIGLVETYRLMQSDEQLTGRGGLPYRMLRPYSWDSEEERACFRLLTPSAVRSCVGGYFSELRTLYGSICSASPVENALSNQPRKAAMLAFCGLDFSRASQ